MKNKEKTVVVFRRWISGDIVALFPYEPHDNSGIYCVSYERIGQHGAADYEGVVSRTGIAYSSDSDVKNLIAELERVGYDLKIQCRAPNAYLRRKEALLKLKKASVA